MNQILVIIMRLAAFLLETIMKQWKFYIDIDCRLFVIAKTLNPIYYLFSYLPFTETFNQYLYCYLVVNSLNIRFNKKQNFFIFLCVIDFLVKSYKCINRDSLLQTTKVVIRQKWKNFCQKSYHFRNKRLYYFFRCCQQWDRWYVFVGV